MRHIALALLLTFATSTMAAAQTSGSDPKSGTDLWGQQDDGEDKGRVHATGRSYNTTHIAYGAVVVAIMAVFLIVLIRRHSAAKQTVVGGEDAT